MSGWCAAERDMQGVVTFQGIYQAYLDCRRRKCRTANAQRYEMHLLDHLLDTRDALNQRCYTPSRSLCFLARRPKLREIHAADFSDRVVHHWLVPRLEAIYEPVFIHDVYSNRQGKGTHKAVARLQGFMQATGPSGWFLQLDIRNFFNTIDKAILFGQIQQRLRKAWRGGKLGLEEARMLRWLSHVLLRHDPTQSVCYRGTAAMFKAVPPHKRLACAEPGKGLPIGNLTSQFFANVYLNDLDQFIKHELKCRAYLRYVDDFILLHEDPLQLQRWQRAIADFLAHQLGLSLRDKHILKPVASGADFLGYIVRPHYRLVRRRVVGNLREKLRVFERQLLSGKGGQAVGLHLRREPREQLRALLASYFGHFRHANSQRLVRRLIGEFPWLELLFDLDQAPQRMIPRWEPSRVSGYRSQLAFFRRQFPNAILHVQRGREVDSLMPEAHVSDEHIRCRVRSIIVREAGYLHGGLKRRLVTRITPVVMGIPKNAIPAKAGIF